MTVSARLAHSPAAAVRSVVGDLGCAGRRHLREGDFGVLPVVLGLTLIAVVFQSQNSHFLSALNLTNLLAQIADIGIIAVGIVFVLLLGEIDLSVGAVSGLCAGVMAVLSVNHGLSGPVAILGGVLCGAAIGLFQGWWTTKLRVASFVVTLAGQLAFGGVLLYVLGSAGTINLNDETITGLANRLLPIWLGWTIGAAFVGSILVASVLSRTRKLRSGMDAGPLSLDVVRLLLLGGGCVAAIGLMSVNRSAGVIPISGIPMGVIIFLGFVVLFDALAQRTRFGREVYAIGGNAEAARRAGINVDRIRITVFMLAGVMAACGGILASSRLYAVNQSSGSGAVLLNAIAAAVIGGTSLFGGRGRVWSALLGALVIGSIDNGMNLLAYSSSVKFTVTGAVLLIAVTIDAVSRRRGQASGRA